MNMRKLDSAMRGNPNKPRYCHFLQRHSSIGIISHKQRYLIIFLSALTAMMLLSSCCTTTSRIEYRDEVGSVLLSVNSVGRWEQVADAMRPNFNLANGDAALSKVLPATARIQQQILEAFGLSLGLGLPQSFRESMVTRTASENQTSTVTGEQTTSVATSSEESTSKSTATKKPGATPTAPSGIPASGEFTSGITPGNDLGIDPLLQYRAAASLYQAVQLMNREVELAAKRKNYVPYMVRMQLATIPYRPHLPYDIHAKVAFFPARKILDFEEADKNTKLPYVVPLIVTDNLEQTIKSRAAEVARQLGLAVSLMVEGVGGNVGSNWQKRNRESVLAADLNSLLTVARLSDNAIYIRLGAVNEATGGNSLVGRTYDIALLLLVPEDYFEKKSATETGSSGSTTTPPILKQYSTCKPPAKIPNADKSDQTVTLSVVTHTDLRNTSTGKLLKERRDVTLVRQIDDAFNRTLRIGYPDMFKAWSHKADDEKLSIAKKLIIWIQTSKPKEFYDETKSIILKTDDSKGDALPPKKDNCLEAESDKKTEERDICTCNDNCKEYRLSCISYLESLWVYLASTTVEASTKAASVELPAPPNMVIPKQTALIRDDGKEKLNIVLRDVSGITPGGISSKLVLKNSEGISFEFPAEIISTDPVTGTLALQFPSPARWNLVSIDYNNSQLFVEPRPCPYRQACANVKIEPSFKVLHVEEPPAKPKPGFDMRATTNEIVVDKGVGTVKLVFDKVKDDSVLITWSGADVKSAKDSDGAPVKITLDKITVKYTTTLTLEIQNAKPNGKVTFMAVGSKNDKNTGEATKEFTVVDIK